MMRKIYCNAVFLPVKVWLIAQFSFQHLLQHLQMQRSTAKKNEYLLFYYNWFGNLREISCISADAIEWQLIFEWYLSSMTQCITAAFNKLTFNCSYAPGNGFHRLEQCIKNWLFQLPSIKMNFFMFVDLLMKRMILIIVMQQ